MGRAIVRDPKVFLFDEPLSNLDAKLRVAMRAEIKALHQRLKTTTVYVTHDQVEAMTMADRIVVMQDGRIEQIGTPLELYDHPANLFVAQFIGSPAMNVVNGTCGGTAASAWVEAEGGVRWPLAADAPGSDGPARRLRHPSRRPRRRRGRDGTVPAEVIVVEPTGAETELLVRAGAGADRRRAPRPHGGARRARRSRSRSTRPAVHLFDPASGACARRLRQNPVTDDTVNGHHAPARSPTGRHDGSPTRARRSPTLNGHRLIAPSRWRSRSDLRPRRRREIVNEASCSRRRRGCCSRPHSVPARPKSPTSPSRFRAGRRRSRRPPMRARTGVDAARHIYASYAPRIYKGRLPPLIHGVVVVETTVDERGSRATSRSCAARRMRPT